MKEEKPDITKHISMREVTVSKTKTKKNIPVIIEYHRKPIEL